VRHISDPQLAEDIEENGYWLFREEWSAHNKDAEDKRDLAELGALEAAVA